MIWIFRCAARIRSGRASGIRFQGRSAFQGPTDCRWNL